MKLQKLIVSAATAAAILTQALRASAGSDETFAQTARLFYWLIPVSRGNANSDSKIQVCVANFDENYKSKTSSAACTGSDLSEAPVMGLDKDGNMSLKWVHDNLAAKIAAL